ncbi:MAG: glycoside hydrolase family protein [Ruminococcus sp.]|nr:glycoside hydrolase family protein [Ruminococcus sp.]
MKTSANGIELIKSFEGCKLTAYRDAVGVLTIGYGHTSGVKEGDKITQKKADELLAGDLLRFETRVNYWSEKKYFFNQNEFDALVSFAYNCGNGNLDGLLKNGRNSRGQIADDILLYNKAGGKMLTGLAKRRSKERALFLSPVETVSNNTPKTNDEIAREVIAGKWLNGDERKQKLKAAGYNPTVIQKLVNEITKERNREIAFEVIAGQYGNGEERKRRLKAAGYNPTTIQKIVNELM